MSGSDLVDRPTQIICISYIYLFCSMRQHTNTKDIALVTRIGGARRECTWFPLPSLLAAGTFSQSF